MNVGVAEALGVNDAWTVAVGGSSVGGGLSVIDGVSVAMGDGVMLATVVGVGVDAVGVRASAAGRVVLVGGAPTIGRDGWGISADRFVPIPNAAMISTRVTICPAEIRFNGQLLLLEPAARQTSRSLRRRQYLWWCCL